MTDERLEIARQRLSYDPDIPEDTDLEVLAVVPILWSGWECDDEGVLYRILPDGGPKLHVSAAVNIPHETLIETLESRCEVYEDVLERTRAFIATAKQATR